MPVVDSELLRVAAETFERQLPDLLAEHRGQWVAFLGPERVEIRPDADKLYETIRARKIPFRDVFIRRIERVPAVHLNWNL